MAEEKNEQQNVRDFSKVILTLENVQIPQEKLSPTPSMIDGMDEEVELDLRILGCELIQTSGILLKLPQVAMATGQVLFQRFYYSKSFVKHTMEVVAMACINLASKIEEAPRRIRDVVNVFHHIKQVKAGRTISPLILDQNYINLKNQVIKAERRILKELGFCVHVKHPHKIIVTYLRSLGCENRQRFVQCAWNYMNDSFRTNAFVRYPPETIACACIYLAARALQIVLPKSPPWFQIFGATEDEIQDICLSILRLYARPKPNADKLEQVVNELKKVQIEARLKARGGGSSNAATPNSESRPATPSKVDSPMGSQLKKVKEEDRRSDHSFGRDLPKKRSHSPASRDSHSRSRSRSRSRSYRSSRSRSRSPAPKKRVSSPRNRYKEKPKSKYSKTSKTDSYDKYDNRNHKTDKYNHRDKTYDRVYDDKYSSNKRDKVYYYDKDYKRKRGISPITYTRNSRSISPEVKSKKRKDRYRSRSRSRSYERRKPKKHNGHRRSRSRDRY